MVLTHTLHGTLQIESLELEIAVYRRLRHPNIITFIARVQGDEHRLSFLLELCPRGSLRRVLVEAGAAVSLQQRHRWAVHVVRGLVALHDNGVAHRDLKPANVLVDENGVCKVTDFGLSKAVSDISQGLARSSNSNSHVGVGTTQYMAPEMRRRVKPGQAAPSPRAADVWSLGCTLLELFTGRMPYTGMIDAEITTAQLVDGEAPPELEDLESLPGVGPALHAVVAQCLQLAPAARPDAAKVLEQLQGLALPAPPPPQQAALGEQALAAYRRVLQQELEGDRKELERQRAMLADLLELAADAARKNAN